MARSLVDHALDWGWDDEHGGFYDKGESFAGTGLGHDESLVDRGRGPQRPAGDAPRSTASKTDRYAKAFRKQWDFIEKHMIDPQSMAAGSPRPPATAP